MAATTIDAICQRLGLDRIDFLKMNIEGAERLAIQGMTETLQQTSVLCISCHDFLADAAGDEGFRTKATVLEFLEQRGFRVVERSGAGLLPYVRDQVWAFREGVTAGIAANNCP